MGIHKGKKLIVYLVVTVLLILSASYLFYKYPREINRELNGKYYRLGDSSFSEKVLIKINGSLSRKILKGDEFTGSIQVGDKVLSRIKLKLKHNSDLISYYDEAAGDYTSYGIIYTKDLNKSLTICVYTKSKNSGTWYGKDGYMISAPAGNREEALKLSNQLMYDFYKTEFK